MHVAYVLLNLLCASCVASLLQDLWDFKAEAETWMTNVNHLLKESIGADKFDAHMK